MDKLEEVLNTNIKDGVYIGKMGSGKTIVMKAYIDSSKDINEEASENE